MKAILIVIALTIPVMAFAESPKVYTDQDLSTYRSDPNFVEDPILKRKIEEGRRYGKQKEDAAQAEKDKKKAEAEEQRIRRMEEEVLEIERRKARAIEDLNFNQRFRRY